MIYIKKIMILILGLSFILLPSAYAAAQVGPELKSKIDALKDPLLNILKLDAQSLKTDLDANVATAKKAVQDFEDAVKGAATPAVTPAPAAPAAEAPKTPDAAATPAVTLPATPAAAMPVVEAPKAPDAVATPAVTPSATPAPVTPASTPAASTPVVPAVTTPIEVHAPIEVK